MRSSLFFTDSSWDIALNVNFTFGSIVALKMPESGCQAVATKSVYAFIGPYYGEYY